MTLFRIVIGEYINNVTVVTRGEGETSQRVDQKMLTIRSMLSVREIRKNECLGGDLKSPYHRHLPGVTYYVSCQNRLNGHNFKC